MTIEEINKFAYSFVDAIDVVDIIKEPEPEHKGSLAEVETIVVLDNIIDDYFTQTSIFPNGNRYIVAVQFSGKEYKFGKKDFLIFRDFLHKVYSKHFIAICLIDLIEDLTYKWIVNIKKTGKSTIDYFLFLQNHLETHIKSFRYYYPVFNLHIEDKFDIGNVQFSFFNKGQFKNEGKIGEFDFYKKIAGKVFVSSLVKAESSKAKDISFSECCLAFDVLKLFIRDFLMPAEKLYVDIEHRASFNFSDDYFSVINDDFDTVNLTLGARNRPIILKKEHLKQFQKEGLDVFSNYLNTAKNTELKLIIANSIRNFAVAITNDDLHLRSSLLISVCEMLLLKETEKNFTACLCQKRFLAVVGNLNSADKDIAKSILVEFYELRNKYIHNGKRLSIDLSHLLIFQRLLRYLIVNMILLSNNNKDKNELLDKYDFFEECKKESNERKKASR